MLLLAFGCAGPLLVVAIVFALPARAGARAAGPSATQAEPTRPTTHDPRTPPPFVRATAGRWDALAEEIAGRGDRRPRRRSDRAARRRHLAAVLPADARR